MRQTWLSMSLSNCHQFPQSIAHATTMPHIHSYIPTYLHIAILEFFHPW